MPSPEPPLRAPKRQIKPGNQRQHRENHLQGQRFNLRSQKRARQGPQHDKRQPSPQQRPIHRAFFGMCQHRSHRGHNDGGKRGCHTNLHQLWPLIAQMRKGVEKRRHQHDAAPHPQKPRNHPRNRTDCQQKRHHGQKRCKIGHRVSPYGLAKPRPRLRAAPAPLRRHAPTRPAPRPAPRAPHRVCWHALTAPAASPARPHGRQKPPAYDG